MKATKDELAMLMTPEQAARQLCVGRDKVYQLIKRGKLRSLKIEGSRRISVEALRLYVAEREAS